MPKLEDFLGETEYPFDGTGDNDTWNAARNALRVEIRERIEKYNRSLESLVVDWPAEIPPKPTPDEVFRKQAPYLAGYQAGYKKGLRNRAGAVTNLPDGPRNGTYRATDKPQRPLLATPKPSITGKEEE